MGHAAQTWKRPWEVGETPANSQQENRVQSYNHKEINSANSLNVEPECRREPWPPDENAALPAPWFQLVRDPEQETQLFCVQTSNLQKL